MKNTSMLFPGSIVIAGLLAGCGTREDSPGDPSGDADAMEPSEPTEPMEPTEPAEPTTPTGKIVNLPDCAQATVNSAISAAASGDVLVCPAGSWAWSDVNITNHVTLKGAGMGMTNISITAAAGLDSPASYTGPFRVTGFTFTSTANFGTDDGYGMFRVRGNKGFRVTHNEFRIYSTAVSYNGGNGIVMSGDVSGVIDRNRFVPAPNSSGCMHASTYEIGNNLEDWYLPSQLGSDEHTVFIENNYFSETKTGSACNAHTPHAAYGQQGGFWVFRHNEVHNMNVDAHGFEVTVGTREFEVSNNTFYATNAGLYRAMYWRGGTGVVYRNTLAEEGTGTITYAAGLVELRANTNRGNPSRPELYAGVPSSTSCAAAEDYPCVDQVGRGRQTGTSPNMSQALDPLYFWDNDFGAASSPILNESTALIAAGRDYYLDQGPKPGYAAYSYPHPLTFVP